MKKLILSSFLLLIFLLTSCSFPKTDTQGIKIPVLMYHHISENPADWSGSTVSPDKFKEDMLYLKALGFQTVLPEDLVLYREGKKELPENPILITFDDGYESNYTYAYPILKDLNMKAVISVVVSTVGKNTLPDGTVITPHFSWEEAKEMVESGLIDIQHHTYDLHKPGDGKYGKGVAFFENETEENYIKRLKEDILIGDKLITDNIGKKPILFAYPYGIFNEQSEKLLKELGYEITLTVKKGPANIEEDLFLLNRYNMPSDTPSITILKEILNDLNVEKEIPFEKITNQNTRIEKLEELVKISI